MRDFGKGMIVGLLMLAAVPVECLADKSTPPTPPSKEPVPVSEACSSQCSSHYEPKSPAYDECVASCESGSSNGLPPSATVAPFAIP